MVVFSQKWRARWCGVRWSVEMNSRVSCWGDEIDAAVHSGVRDALLSGDVDLLLQELLILLVDILGNRFPAEDTKANVSLRETGNTEEKRMHRSSFFKEMAKWFSSCKITHQLSLLIWSPKPGVSTTVSFIFTPPSSITETQWRKNKSTWKQMSYIRGFLNRSTWGALTQTTAPHFLTTFSYLILTFFQELKVECRQRIDCTFFCVVPHSTHQPLLHPFDEQLMLWTQSVSTVMFPVWTL